MVLRELGALLRRQVRASDTACRFGGEEFTLLLSDASAPDALMRCNRLREQIKELVLAHRQQSLGTITASIGLAEYPSHGDSAESLMRAADLALYRAKHQGRDQALIASADDTAGLKASAG
jgi:diguanylate cyclase (GGDEF)-like protein